MKLILGIIFGILSLFFIIYVIYKYVRQNFARVDRNRKILKQIKQIKTKINTLKESLTYLNGFEELEDIRRARQATIENLEEEISELLYLYFKNIFPKVLVVSVQEKLNYIINKDKEIFELIANKIYSTDEIEFMSYDNFADVLNYAFQLLSENGILFHQNFKDKPIKIILVGINTDILHNLTMNKFYLKSSELEKILEIHTIK